MKTKAIIASVLVISISIWGIVKYRSSSAVVEPDAAWVQTLKVKESMLPLEANAIGTLTARSVEITPELAGHVREIYFADGAFVKKDVPLIQLDDAVYKAKLDSTKAQLTYSQADFQRKSLLGKQGVISRQAIDQAEADLKEKAANAKENAVMVSKMRLTAPFDGMVDKCKINLGDYVTTGQSLVTLTDTKHLRIEYNVPEKYLPALKPGQTVSITTTTYPGKIFTGKVSYISPTINIENRSVALYAEVANEDQELAPGMFVNVVQSLGKDERVVMVPARSLVPILDGEQVFKVMNGKAYATTVLIGKRVNDDVQVTEGITTGDVIITDGQLKIKNGMPVQVKS